MNGTSLNYFLQPRVSLQWSQSEKENNYYLCWKTKVHTLEYLLKYTLPREDAQETLNGNLQGGFLLRVGVGSPSFHCILYCAL